MRPTFTRLRWLTCCLFALGLLAACSAPVDDAYARWAQVPYSGVPTDVLGEGDRFSIRVFQEPEMSGEYIVSQGGSIRFPLIGEVHVAGRSCAELEQEIGDRLAEGFLRSPSVSCQVIEVRSLVFVVSGEVASPGVFPFTPNMTVIEAIALAQGLTANAANDRVVVTRIVDGERHEIVVPFQRILNGRAPNLRLWPNDSVFVPSFRLIP
jgi:polysaccharide export outer membrane protein